MSFYSRKSVSFGGVRLTFSKSGIGASVGIRGFRIGTGPRGNYIRIGTNGLSYKTMIGKGKSREGTRDNPASYGNGTINQPSDVIMHEIESRDALEIFDSSSQEILSEINRKYKKFPLWTLGVAIAALLSSSSYMFLGLLSIVASILLDRYRKTTTIIYDIDEATESKIQAFYDSFNDIMSADRKWHISASGDVTDRKYHAGASTLIARSSISINYSIPKYIRTNVKVPCIPVGKQKLYFFPDKILIVQRRQVGAVSYGRIRVECTETRFIEEGAVPGDTTVVDHTWRYVNKNGGPDRRFKNNRQLPIVLYSQLHFSSNTGLNELVHVSRPGVGNGLKQYLNEYDFSYTKDRLSSAHSSVAPH